MPIIKVMIRNQKKRGSILRTPGGAGDNLPKLFKNVLLDGRRLLPIGCEEEALQALLAALVGKYEEGATAELQDGVKPNLAKAT